MCIHKGKHATNANMFGCIVIVQIHVMFVGILGRVRFNQLVCEPPVDAEHAVYVYVHAR